MSGSLTRPDFSADIKDLLRRVGILERRTTPKAPDVPVGHTHDGTDPDNTSTITHPSSDATSVSAGYCSTAMGYNAVATEAYSIALGFDSESGGQGSVNIGNGGGARADGTIAVGSGANANAYNGVAVGPSSNVDGEYSTAVGAATHAAAGSYSTALGAVASADHETATAIGAFAATTSDHEIMLGTDAEHVAVPGRLVITSPGGTKYYLDVSDAGVLSTSVY